MVVYQLSWEGSRSDTVVGLAVVSEYLIASF